MLVLICKLLFISCSCDCEAEDVFDLRIINCENEKGDLVDTGFLIDKYTYKIKLTYNEEFWSISICLHIGSIQNFTVVEIDPKVLLKCTEDIGKGNCNNGFITGFNQDVDFSPSTNVDDFFSSMSCVGVYKFSFDSKQAFFSLDRTVVSNQKANKHFSEEIIKLTRLNYFRKKLGIFGGGIKTSMFKFRFVYNARNCFNSSIFKKITFETEPFGFSLNKNGTLVLNKLKKLEKCGMRLGFNS
ncbi:hypothetical protein CDIK_2653 [Cucumispora dikerogammari]|nr:hypothetical protein CDIK_2653 [Cucumispora dikerogammari]